MRKQETGGRKQKTKYIELGFYKAKHPMMGIIYHCIRLFNKCDKIGDIVYDEPYNRWVYFPSNNEVLTIEYLRDIVDFIEQLNKEIEKGQTALFEVGTKSLP
jgi:hypothetical protein